MNNKVLFCSQLIDYIDAGVGVIHVKTDEILRATNAVRNVCLNQNRTYLEWDAVNGMQEFRINKITNNNNELNIQGDGNTDILDNVNKVLLYIKETVKTLVDPVWVFVNPQSYPLDTPMMQQYLLLYQKVLPETSAVVIFITTNQPFPVPQEYQPSSIEFKLPSSSELKDVMQQSLTSLKENYKKEIKITEEQITDIANNGSGMTVSDFEKSLYLACVSVDLNLPSNDIANAIKDKILEGKLETIKNSEVLELLKPVPPEEVSAMSNLKNWIKKRANLLSEEATKYGIKSPKGIVLVGLNGTGKSLSCSMIAHMLGIPIVRLDISRVFDGLVGGSERRMSNALRMVEHISPVVLMIDEITRVFAGSSANNDAGVSQRIMAKFLTFLQEAKNVFVVATANSLEGLPPELLRKGRFDAIFYTTLPTKLERKETLHIHLKKVNRDMTKFSNTSLESFLIASEGYIQSEIEAAVNEGLIDSFYDKEELTLAHIEKALVTMPPISKSFKSQIEATQAWGIKHAIPVSISEQLISPPQTASRTIRKVNVIN